MLLVRLEYENIFDEPIELTIQEILQEISFYIVAMFVADLNQKLFMKVEQNDLIHGYLTDNALLHRIRLSLNQKEGNVLFSRNVNYELLHQAALYSIDDENHDINDTVFQDAIPELIKLILIINSQKNINQELNGKLDRPFKYYRENFWASGMQEVTIQNWKNPLNSLVKGLSFLNYLEKNYQDELKYYLENYGFKDKWGLIQCILQPAYTWFHNDVKIFYSSEFSTNCFLDDLSLDLKEYRKKYTKGGLYYQGFRETPLYSSINNNRIVLDWNLMTDQLYNSFVFKFYKKNKRKIGLGFLDFKNKSRNEGLIENVLFPKILINCFNPKYNVILFDNEIRSGFGNNKGVSLPDAYVRVNKKIFLFEIKDSFFSSKAIDSGNYEDIKDEIDLKFNSINKKGTELKGVEQIINQMEFLKSNNSFEENFSFDTSKYELYPVIIFTDEHFGLPGIGKYLDEEFMRKLKERNLEKSFKKIQRMSFLSLDFFISNYVELSKGKYRLDKIINKGFEKLRCKEKNIGNLRTKNPYNNLFIANQNLEDVIYELPNFESKNISSMKILEELGIIKSGQI